VSVGRVHEPTQVALGAVFLSGIAFGGLCARLGLLGLLTQRRFPGAIARGFPRAIVGNQPAGQRANEQRGAREAAQAQPRVTVFQRSRGHGLPRTSTVSPGSAAVAGETVTLSVESFAASASRSFAAVWTASVKPTL